jgi:hypothetical protein
MPRLGDRTSHAYPSRQPPAPPWSFQIWVRQLYRWKPSGVEEDLETLGAPWV